MARVLGVHGIGQQLKGAETLASVWQPAIADGMTNAGATPILPDDFACAFYGDVFRARAKSSREPEYTALELADEYEVALVKTLASGVPGEALRGTRDEKFRTPNVIQLALSRLTRSRYFAGIAESLVIADLKQVRAYFTNDDVRATVQGRVEAAVADDTQVIIGHSLGSVVAYEALVANPGWPVRALVTLGSPLGIRNLVFDRLRPLPTNGIGAWPQGVITWVNVADRGDIVALTKNLAPLFGGAVVDVAVENGANAHDASPYLTARETGEAVSAALGS